MTPARPLFAPSIKLIQLGLGTPRTIRSLCAQAAYPGPASPAAPDRLALVPPPQLRAVRDPLGPPENALVLRTRRPRFAITVTFAHPVSIIATVLAITLPQAAARRARFPLLPAAASARTTNFSMVPPMSAITAFFALRVHTTVAAAAITPRTMDAATARLPPLARVAERLISLLFLYITRVFPFRGWKSSQKALRMFTYSIIHQSQPLPPRSKLIDTTSSRVECTPNLQRFELVATLRGCH